MTTDNPICAAMNWPVPGPEEVLLISVNARPVATLTPRRGSLAEGVYLINAGYGVPNPCCSVRCYPSETSSVRAKRALAKKLFANGRNLQRGEIHELVARLENRRLDTVTVEVR